VNVLRQVYRILMMDPRRLVDDNGAPIPLRELPDDVAAAIQAVEIEDQEASLPTGIASLRKTARQTSS
jgi:hypothetical protein